MVYRNQYIEADLGENNLRKMADLGRLRAERLRRQEEIRKAKAERKAAIAARKAGIAASVARRERLASTLSRWAPFRTRLSLIYTVSGIALWAILPIDKLPMAVTVSVWILALLPVAVVLLAHCMTKRGIRSERLWLEGLGYEVGGYFESLTESNRDRSVRFNFRNRAPDEQLVSDILCAQGVDGWTVEVGQESNMVVLSRRSYIGPRKARKAFHAALEVGRLLHEVYPIRLAQVICA